MTDNELTYKIIHCAMEVYNHLGPGLLEEVYERALMYELVNAGLKAESQVALPLVYKGVDLEKSYRVDILVEEKITRCYYGHLHSYSHTGAFIGVKDGIRFSLISSDFLGFCPALVY